LQVSNIAFLYLFTGGHTAEMLTLLGKFDLQRYSPRRYIVAATDTMSGHKAQAFERTAVVAAGACASCNSFEIVAIPRSREVGQSFRSSTWTTIVAAFYAVRAVLSFKPDLVLTNGPGTALPVVIAALLGKILGITSPGIVYVESIARVRHLSLTGKILYHLRLTDEFLVQWEELRNKYPRAVNAGRLM
jgi:beta-1,4-N-acetylglucosaminyltransferase